MGCGSRVGRAAAICLLLVSAAAAYAKAGGDESPVPVVMLSDVHFDPYHDPSKLTALRSADISQWPRILLAPDDPNQPEAYEALQKSCHARGEDSSWGLMNRALDAAHIEQPSPLFVVVGGDLLTHAFDCRMQTLVPSATPEDIAKFAAKTIAFVSLQIRRAFPNVPVYMALGNNDSGCTNYHQTAGSEFVQDVATTSAAGFVKRRDEKEVLGAFSHRGDYSVLLPGAMSTTRLVILQDVFESPSFRDCSGGANPGEAALQAAWLRAQLVAARRDHQHVWVMAHIPPGVDEYASFHKYIGHAENMCEVTAPTSMLSSERLADTLLEFSDVVRLAIFAHTHMDEMKLLHKGAEHRIAAKLIPSVSPINGNNPAFTVAEVDPKTATLLDYSVYVASDKAATAWSEEYKYSAAYRMKDFSAESVGKLTSTLSEDKQGTSDTSAAYQRWFLPGDTGEFARGLKEIWPAYGCSTVEDGGTAYHDCMCGGSAAPAASAARGK